MQTQQLHADERVVALRVIHRGEEYGLSLVTVKGVDVTIEPFERETAGTTFHSGTIVVLRQGAQTATDWHRPGDRPLLLRR